MSEPRPYRGKRVDNGEWVKGSLIVLGKKTKIVPTESIDFHNGVPLTYSTVEVVPSTVGQSTGKEDRDRQEIYEGDILQHPSGERFKVIWNHAHTGFRAWYLDETDGMLSLQISDNGLAVVIGNIHDNADMLEGGE